MANSSLFNLLNRTPPASNPALVSNPPPTLAAEPPLQVAPQFRNWFLNYARTYQGDPQAQVKRLNLSPAQDQQVRAMVQRIMPFMRG